MDKSKFKSKDDFIFCHLDGSPFTTKQFRTQFESMTLYSNEDERWGKHFVPYSIRSFYATTRLQNGTSTYALCKNMGMTEPYLRKHYSKYMIDDLNPDEFDTDEARQYFKRVIELDEEGNNESS